MVVFFDLWPLFFFPFPSLKKGWPKKKLLYRFFCHPLFYNLVITSTNNNNHQNKKKWKRQFLPPPFWKTCFWTKSTRKRRKLCTLRLLALHIYIYIYIYVFLFCLSSCTGSLIRASSSPAESVFPPPPPPPPYPPYPYLSSISLGGGEAYQKGLATPFWLCC